MVDKIESKIGESMVITGDIYCEHPVVLEGKVAGSFAGKKLIVCERAQVKGDVSGEVIECFGRMEGAIVTSSFILRKSGCHVGTVETTELTVESGAILDCALQSGVLKP